MAKSPLDTLDVSKGKEAKKEVIGEAPPPSDDDYVEYETDEEDIDYEEKEESLVKVDVKEVEEFNSKTALKKLEARMDYLDQSRSLVLKKLKKTRFWIKYENKKAGTVTYRLRKGAVNRMMAPFGITSRVISTKTIEKANGTSDYEAVVELGFSEFPDYFIQRTGTVNSTEVFYRSQVEADQKYSDGKKFGKGASVEISLSHNCRQHAVTRAMTNTFSALLGMEDIDDEEMKAAGIEFKKILSPYGK